jgi:hypothetical protein
MIADQYGIDLGAAYCKMLTRTREKLERRLQSVAAPTSGASD